MIDKSSVEMRIDRWIKTHIGKIPQALIEKSLRKGKIKLNGKRIKSSTKLKLNDV
jgi:Pseudouridylate synthases, 23S RNA-specific